MTPEIFKLAMPDRVLIFTIAPDIERLNAMGRIIQALGGTVIDSQVFAMDNANLTPEILRDALGELEEGERVYLVSAAGEAIETRVFVRPKTEGGITISGGNTD